MHGSESGPRGPESTGRRIHAPHRPESTGRRIDAPRWPESIARRIHAARWPETTTRRIRARPHAAGAAGLALGLALASAPTWTCVLLTAALLGAAGAGRAPTLVIAAGLVLAGAALGQARLDALDRCPGGACLRAGVAAEAELLERPRGTRFGSQARVEIRAGPARGVRVLARTRSGVHWPRGADPGTRVLLAGSPRPLPGGADPGAGYADHLRRQGVVAELRLRSVRPAGRRGGLGGAVDDMRHRAERAVGLGLPRAKAALARGMVLGQDDAIDPLVREDFRRSGLAHVLAVSGQNVMLLAALALPLLSFAGLRPGARIGVLLVLIAVYVPLAGAGPALQRAAAMGAAGLAAMAAGRPASRAYALSLAAVATLAWNPRVAGDPGWQLSFAAVAGIVVLAPRLRRPLRRLPGLLADGLAVTIAATLATAPLVAHHFGTVSLAGLGANLVALPLVAPIVWLGLLSTALAQVPALLPALAPATDASCRALAAANGVLLGVLDAVARWFAELPGAAVEVPLDSAAAVMLAYAAMGLGALLLHGTTRRLEPRAREAGTVWRALGARRHVAIACTAAAIVALGCAEATDPPEPPRGLTVSFLDVGQGDATLIQDGHGAAILFDAGPPEARVARQLRHAGVRRLDAVVATHPSRDHHGGLPEVFARFRVKLLVDGGDGTRDATFNSAIALAVGRGARRVAAHAGQTFRVGRLTIRVLSPPSRPPGPPPEDPNPRAIAAVVTEGSFDLFLSADAESPALLGLQLPDVDAMKVPHHGSADPGLPELLARLKPEVAAIEVGAHNSYGHPTASTLAALHAHVPHVFRTDRDGTVRLTVGSRGLLVRSER